MTRGPVSGLASHACRYKTSHVAERVIGGHQFEYRYDSQIQGFTFSSRYTTNLRATLSSLQSTLPFSVVPSVTARL